LKQLFLLDAIDSNGNITALGMEMCKLPLEPNYSKALISSLLMDCSQEMLTVKKNKEFRWSFLIF